MKTMTINCPRCGMVKEGYPALSRTDNETDICSECGLTEALEQWSGFLKPQSEWEREYVRRNQ